LMVSATKPHKDGKRENSARVLIELGASIDLAADNGVTALIHAASQGTARIVRILLDHGADVEKADASGRTALGGAAQAGDVEIVRMLLERGADPNRAQDKNGATPLMFAAAAGHVGVMAALVERGVAIDQTTAAGWTALMSAVFRDQMSALRWLLDGGAQP